MTKIIEKIKNNKIETLFIAIVVVIFIILTFDFTPTEKEQETPKETIKKDTNKEVTSVMVDIKGAVNTPSVYEMKSTDRVIDVIKKAGGLKANADTSLINLSKKVTDEMVITIYTKEEMQAEAKECPPCECPEVNDACIEEDNKVSDSKETSADKTNKQSSQSPDGKISINTASSEELQTLDGIGETKAEAIIGYRETNGAFKSIEELKNVSGIGDATYEKIKDDITI